MHHILKTAATTFAAVLMAASASAQRQWTVTGQPFPADVKNALQHIILSHHGSFEFGSPKLPAMPEAVALHHLDNLDAKLDMYLSKIEADPDPAGDWTEYVRNLQTKIFKKDVLGIRS